MSPKIIFLTLLSAGSCLANAQSVNFLFPDDGDRQMWIADTSPSPLPNDSEGVRTGKSAATLPINGHKDTSYVFLWDRKTGNIAMETVSQAKATTWVVKDSDYKDIAQVSVRVEHDGKPVAAATVLLSDGRRVDTQLLDPSSKGVVTFFDVKPGSLKVTVHYKVAGKDAPLLTQLFTTLLTRPDSIPIEKISVGDSVDTVGPEAGSTSDNGAGGAAKGDKKDESAKSESKPDEPSIFGRVIEYVLVLGAMAAAIYYGLMYMKNNSDSVASKLEQMGVQIPKAGGDPLADPSQMTVPGRPAPAPVQKIILDDAAPDLIAPVVASSRVSDPRLVSQSGDAMPLPEGELIVGREVGLGLSLVGESTVSRKHAQLTRLGDSVVVTDFGSTNGTFVNGVQIQGEKQLQSGDAVQFGSVRFKYEG